VRSFVEEDGENRKRRKEALAVPAPPPKHHQGTAMRVVDDDDASGGEEAHAMSVKHGACERQARAGPRLCGPARRATTRGNGLQRLSAGARGRARGPTWKTVCSPASTCFPRLHRGSALTSLPCSTVLPPSPRTKWTRRVPHPVLIGHDASHPAAARPAAASGCGAPPRVMPRGTASRARRRSRPRVSRAGHGGAKAADYALETLPADLRARLAAMPAGGGEREIQAAVSAPPPPRTKWTRRAPHPVLIGHDASLSQVSAAFVDLDREFLARARAERLSDGTTALLALLRADTLHVSWVGDSRGSPPPPPPLRTRWTRRVPRPVLIGHDTGVLSRRGRAVRLSEDHKPDRPDERKALEARGGSIVFRGAYRCASLPRRGAHAPPPPSY
jgi:hypothetical protein